MIRSFRAKELNFLNMRKRTFMATIRISGHEAMDTGRRTEPVPHPDPDCHETALELVPETDSWCKSSWARSRSGFPSFPGPRAHMEPAILKHQDVFGETRIWIDRGVFQV